MHFAALNGVTLHYQLVGAAPDRPVVVFINSLGTDFRIWRDVIVRLAGDVGVVLYDKRGHGLSGVGDTPYSIDYHVGDLEALLHHLRTDRVVLCGLSVGGLIAQGLYAKRPDLVRGLILCNTASRIGTADLWRDRIGALERGGIEAVADGVMQRWFTAAFRAPENAALDGYRTMLVRQPLDGYIATCAALRDADFTEAAGRIAAPTLCIAGDQDGSTPPDVVLTLARQVPNARYEVIAGSGHIPCVEQPAVLAQMIKDFLPLIDPGTRDG